MVAVQKDYWYLLVLMMSLCFLKGSVQEKAPESKVLLQEEMILDCLCPWTGQLTMVSWTKKSFSGPVAVYHPDFGTNFGKSYEGRVEFLKTTPLDGSIVMRNVTEADTGHYQCSLQTYPQGSWTKDTHVEKAIINIEYVVAENGNLTITCDHFHNGEVYQVSIEKLDGNEKSSNIMATCRMMDDGLEINEFTNRGRLNCSDAMEVSLHLTDIIKEDGGLYRCNFTSDAGVQSTTVLVTTLPAQEIRSFRLMLYVSIGGGVLCIVLLMILIIFLTWVNRRKRKREKYRIKLQPGKRQKWKYTE